MSNKLENAKKLYLKGIRDGNIDVVDNLTGERYTQHSAGVADGSQGFKDFFKGFIKRTKNRDIRVVRSIEDGNFVFVHVYQDIDNGSAKWVTTDIFDTDKNSKIVEHWDVIAAYVEKDKSVSGNDVILGDFEIKDLTKTEENKSLVRSFLTDIFQNKNYGAIEKYISTEKYIQHNPELPNGIEAVKNFLASTNFNYDFVFKVIGQGDFVVSLSKTSLGSKEMATFDIFRVENGKFVEHWDNKEVIEARTTWANTGKF